MVFIRNNLFINQSLPIIEFNRLIVNLVIFEARISYISGIIVIAGERNYEITELLIAI